MPRRWTRIPALIVAATIVSGVPQALSAQRADDGDASPQRVRFEEPGMGFAFAEGMARSATFRALVKAIDESDGVVYIRRGTCGHGVRACLAMSVTKVGPNRMLRLVIDETTRGDNVLVALGHELHHATEVLHEPAITTGFSMFHFYKSFGSWSGDAFETAGAVHAGEAIQRELAVSRRAHRP